MSVIQENDSQHTERLKFFVCLTIIALFWVLPAPYPVTAMGMRVLGIFIAVIIGWTITNEVWPSLMGFLLFPLSGIITMPEFLATGWGSSTAVFLVFAFGLIQFLEITGLSKHIANWMMSRKFLAGHPWRLVFMLLFMSFIIDCFVKTIVGILLAWELIYRITDAAGMKPKDTFPTLMLIGVTLIGSISLVTMPWSMNAVVDFNVYQAAVGEPVDTGKYLMLSIPFGLLAIGVYMALCKFVFRLDVTPIKEMDDAFLQSLDLDMTTDKKIAAGALAAFVALLLVPSFLPEGFFLTAIFNQVGIVGAVVLIFLVLSLLNKRGDKSFHVGRMLATGIPWNVIIMLSVILVIGQVLMAPATGIKDFLDLYMGPFFADMPVLTLLVVSIVIAVLLTNVMMNMIVVSLLVPILVPLAPQLGVTPEEISYLIIVGSSIALLTPASSAASSLLFPNATWVNKGDIYKYGSVAILATTLLFVAVYFVWRLIFI